MRTILAYLLLGWLIIGLLYYVLESFRGIARDKKQTEYNKHLNKIKSGEIFPDVDKYIEDCIKDNIEDTGKFIAKINLKFTTLGSVSDINEVVEYKYKLETKLLIFENVIKFYGGKFQYIDQRILDQYYAFDQYVDGIVHYHKDVSAFYIFRVKTFNFYILTQRYRNEGYFITLFRASNEIAENIDKSIISTKFKPLQLMGASYKSLISNSIYNSLPLKEIKILHDEAKKCFIENNWIYSFMNKFAKCNDIDIKQMYNEAAEVRLNELLAKDSRNNQLNDPITCTDDNNAYIEEYGNDQEKIDTLIYDEVEEFVNESSKNEYEDQIDFYDEFIEEIAIDENRKIKELSQKRGIKHLVHFTQLGNLESILKYGIIPVSKHQDKNIKAIINDYGRYDNCTDSTSISVEFPNYKYFYRLRNSNFNKDWIIIKLKPDILWEKECAFCIENAAKSSVSGIPIENRKGIQSFKLLFEDLEGMPTRKQLGIPDNYTTNPQAEILVFDKIETRYIDAIVFNNYMLCQKYNSKVPDFIKIEFNEQLFKYRQDYQWWSA